MKENTKRQGASPAGQQQWIFALRRAAPDLGLGVLTAR